MTDPISPTTAKPGKARDSGGSMRSVVIKEFGQRQGLPWWWKEIQADSELCDLRVKYVSFRDKRSSKEISVRELPALLIAMLPVYLELRRECDYFYTIECSLTTFALSFWQTLLLSRRPRHVVLQFIMRERTSRLGSKIKYLMMKWCFSSLHMAICSASAEAEYYRKAFGWPAKKLAFVPHYTSADLFSTQTKRDEGYLLAAGRVFRDFPTLIAAVRDSSYQTIIVASKSAAKVPSDVANVRVFEDIPFSEFRELIEACRVVVVPLEDRQISVGQIVVLHAMALGKPVIATRTAGTTDYIRHGENGLLVEPYDAPALRRAIDLIMSDDALRTKLGDAAHRTVLQRHLPHHYTQQVRRVLLERGR